MLIFCQKKKWWIELQKNWIQWRISHWWHHYKTWELETIFQLLIQKQFHERADEWVIFHFKHFLLFRWKCFSNLIFKFIFSMESGNRLEKKCVQQKFVRSSIFRISFFMFHSKKKKLDEEEVDRQLPHSLYEWSSKQILNKPVF